MQKKTLIFSLSMLSLLVAGSVLAASPLSMDGAYNYMRRALGASASRLDANRQSGSAGLYGLLDDGKITPQQVASSTLASTTASALAKVETLAGMVKAVNTAAPAYFSAKEKKGIEQAFGNWYQTYCETGAKAEYNKKLTGGKATYNTVVSSSAKTYNESINNCKSAKNTTLTTAKQAGGFIGEITTMWANVDYDNCMADAYKARAFSRQDSYFKDVMNPNNPTRTKGMFLVCTNNYKFAW
jgi:hypothetical protein